MPASARTVSINVAGEGKEAVRGLRWVIASRMLKVRGRTIGADPRIQSHDQAQEDAWERSSRPPGRDAREVWVVPDHNDTVRVGTAVFGGARACLPRSKVSMIVMRPPQHGHGG